MKREKIDRLTLWVLALGLLIAVTLSVAKSTVREYQDLQDQFHRPTTGQAKNARPAR
jgi:hypothetical protein